MSDCISKCYVSLEGSNLKYKVRRKTYDYNSDSGDGKTTQFQSHYNTCHDVIDVEDLMILDVSSYRKKFNYRDVFCPNTHSDTHEEDMIPYVELLSERYNDLLILGGVPAICSVKKYSNRQVRFRTLRT